jgi:hypothetical protein
MLAPSYNDIDLTNTNLLCGFYSIGLIEQYYPNIRVIDACQWRKNGSGDRHGGKGYNWLNNEIKAHLLDEKVVLVIPEDEEVMYPSDDRFTSVLNSYIADEVYLVTQMPDFSIYRDAGINCKMLELPWMMLNDCLCYTSIVNQHPQLQPIKPNKFNYLTFVGREQEHKIALLDQLCNSGLAKYGLLTVMNKHEHNNLHPKTKEMCTINHTHPYREYNEYSQGDIQHELYNNDIKGFMEGGFAHIDGIWVSANVINFMYIRDKYQDVPLVVHSETTTGIFPMTEKSVWPILLGKLFLINGHKGVMSEIQRFYDIDISTFANLNFDTIENEWSEKADVHRIKCMILDNKDLIKDASNVHSALETELKKASYTFGENMYNFFISQLDKIITKEIT